MSDVLDCIWNNWCWLCEAAHTPCEFNDDGNDIGGIVDDIAAGPTEGDGQ